ncbi:hypothetical protein J6590_044067 [Homalodisca vitripennis]|nr:hypothetical protein J6590_044067 [Homalodisca vitripennis]
MYASRSDENGRCGAGLSGQSTFHFQLVSGAGVWTVGVKVGEMMFATQNSRDLAKAGTLNMTRGKADGHRRSSGAIKEQPRRSARRLALRKRPYITGSTAG